MNARKSVVMCLALLLSLALLAGCVSKEKYDQAVTDKNTADTALRTAEIVASELGVENEALKNQLSGVQENLAVAEGDNADLEESVDNLSEELSEFRQAQTDATNLEARSHKIDNLNIGAEVFELATDNELSQLFDGEVEFDDENYEAEEFFVLNGVDIASNKEDMGSVTYLSFPDDSVFYAVQFEDTLVVSQINSEETLTFDFLGEEWEIIEWDNDEITLTQGVKYYLSEGEKVTVEDHIVTLITTGEDWAYVDVDGTKETIDEGDSAKVNGIDIGIEEVMYQGYAGGVKSAELKIGKDVEVTIEDGDEYAEDSIWEWSINPNAVALVLAEEHADVDDDEDFKALATDEKICLPNSYICVKYDGLSLEDYYGYDFSFDTENGIEYVLIEGDFSWGLESYDQIYFDGVNFLDEDLEVIGNTIVLDKPELMLSNGEGVFLLGDVSIAHNLTTIFSNGLDISGHDEDFITVYGIKIKNPEDGVEEHEFELDVPEEQLEATITIIYG